MTEAAGVTVKVAPVATPAPYRGTGQAPQESRGWDGDGFPLAREWLEGGGRSVTLADAGV